MLGEGAGPGGDGPQESSSAGAGASGTGTDASAPRVRTEVVVGTVVGRLPGPRRRTVAAKVARVVDGWWDAAFVERDYPSTRYGDAFPGFTRGARQAAQQQRALMSTVRIGERIDGVRALRRRVSVDVLATGGSARAVTARTRMDFVTSGRVERRIRVQGRLRMIWQDGGWKVFAFDVTQGPKPQGRA